MNKIDFNKIIDEILKSIDKQLIDENELRTFKYYIKLNIRDRLFIMAANALHFRDAKTLSDELRKLANSINDDEV